MDTTIGVQRQDVISDHPPIVVKAYHKRSFLEWRDQHRYLAGGNTEVHSMRQRESCDTKILTGHVDHIDITTRLFLFATKEYHSSSIGKRSIDNINRGDMRDQREDGINNVGDIARAIIYSDIKHHVGVKIQALYEQGQGIYGKAQSARHWIQDTVHQARRKDTSDPGGRRHHVVG